MECCVSLITRNGVISAKCHRRVRTGLIEWHWDWENGSVDMGVILSDGWSRVKIARWMCVFDDNTRKYLQDLEKNQKVNI